jgi:hypothetical protein
MTHVDKLIKRIDQLLQESEEADKLGLQNRSMELLGQAAELEVQLLKLRKEAARARSVQRMVEETVAKTVPGAGV